MYGADVGNRIKSAKPTCHRSILFYLKMMVISILMLLCLFALKLIFFFFFHLLDVDTFQGYFFVQTLCFIKLIINDFHMGFNKSVEYVFKPLPLNYIFLLPFQVSVVLSFSNTRLQKYNTNIYIFSFLI